MRILHNEISMAVSDADAKKILQNFKKESDKIISDLIKIAMKAQKKVDNEAYRKALEQLKLQ